MNKNVYTIGYATKPIDVFIDQLKKYGVTAVVDVRSVPFSKVFFDYHQPSIKSSLNANGIHYIYMGEELGPRSKDEAHYNDNHQVQFDRLMKSPLFLSGIDRIIDGVNKGHCIGLMCAEKDPLTCHRSLLIGYFLLREKQIDVNHILHDGDLISQQSIENEMTMRHGASEDLFMDRDQIIDQAWRCQCTQSNYVKSDS